MHLGRLYKHLGSDDAYLCRIECYAHPLFLNSSDARLNKFHERLNTFLTSLRTFWRSLDGC